MSTLCSLLSALCPQVLDVKPVTGKAGGQPRIRMVISDGAAAIPAMLATQLNESIEKSGVHLGSIIRLTEYIVNVVQGKT